MKTHTHTQHWHRVGRVLGLGPHAHTHTHPPTHTHTHTHWYCVGRAPGRRAAKLHLGPHAHALLLEGHGAEPPRVVVVVRRSRARRRERDPALARDAPRRRTEVGLSPRQGRGRGGGRGGGRGAGAGGGTTTGRKRKVNWLNLDKLVYATNMSGVTDLIISKVDIIKKIHIFQLFFDNKIVRFDNFIEMQQFIEIKIKNSCKFVKNIIYSEDLEEINI